jgi:hypothetical protein
MLGNELGADSGLVAVDSVAYVDDLLAAVLLDR